MSSAYLTNKQDADDDDDNNNYNDDYDNDNNNNDNNKNNDNNINNNNNNTYIAPKSSRSQRRNPDSYKRDIMNRDAHKLSPGLWTAEDLR